MEETLFLKSRKNEGRSLMKRCFKNPIFSLVPFEIWRDLIVSSADLKAITFLSQTCFAFKEVVDVIGENNFNLALLFRKEGQIVLARKYLFKCAENNNSLAMYYIGYAYRNDGWGLMRDEKKAVEWFKKSAELGNAAAMSYYAYCLRHGYGVGCDVEQSDYWAKKVVSSNNPFAIGFCHDYDLLEGGEEEAYKYYEISAKEGDAIGQLYLAFSLHYGFGCDRNFEKSFELHLKLANEGWYESQDEVAKMYHSGEGCAENEELSIVFRKKAQKQFKKSVN